MSFKAAELIMRPNFVVHSKTEDPRKHLERLFVPVSKTFLFDIYLFVCFSPMSLKTSELTK